MNKVDSIRLEEFRQVKKEIRGSEDYLIDPSSGSTPSPSHSSKVCTAASILL